jgi:hypothetical protein
MQMDIHVPRLQSKLSIRHELGVQNVDALSYNPIASHDEDEDFGVEIQDDKKNVNLAQVWKCTTLSPHMLIIS